MERTAAILDYARLEREASNVARRFAAGDPIRHVVLEDFLEAETARRAARAFPAPAEMGISFAGLAEVKSAEEGVERLDAVYPAIFNELRTPRFVAWLTTITGFEGLTGDPGLHGGGLHQGPDGSFLDVHADFNVHPTLKLYRRLNLLIYLNETWKPEWQGYLELWSRDMKECRQYIEPKFNRAVLMETHDHAFHGYKELRLPQGVTRRSLASYYYSPQRSEAQTTDEHDTLFQLRPEQQSGAGVRQYFRRLAALAPEPARPIVRAVRKFLRLE
ncbi:MAG: 2OG-Fe(II) oxygenase [Candidatus Eremiobacteraeota bacterium]|nr:2OG-Fe(II) oxygenase [Candidatus Eremiobacteraeota bacterium]